MFGIIIKICIIFILGISIYRNFPTLTNNINYFVEQASFIAGLNKLPDGIVAEDKEQMVQLIWEGLLNREEKLDIVYVGSFEDIEAELQEINDIVIEKDDLSTSTDSDYLQYICTQYHYIGSYTRRYSKLEYTFTYIESKEQTDKIDSEIQRLFAEWNITERTDYEKVKIIHDYIVEHVAYDNTLSNYSAYNAMFDRKAVCQGYALLAYKMLIDAGIPSRIISGTAAGEAHAWNIVALDGIWYNLDCTWDDPIMPDGSQTENISYNYFLKGIQDFDGHIREEHQDTEQFHQRYPMADYGYQVGEDWKE